MTRTIDQLRDEPSREMKKENWAKAVELLEESRSLVEGDARLSWTLGWAYFKLDSFERAVECLARAADLDPENPVTHWALAEALSGDEQVEEAEDSFKRALALKDAYTARLGLAFLYQRQGRHSEAELVHKEGIRLTPDHRERLEAYADFLDDVDRQLEAETLREEAKQLPTREQRRSRS